MSTNCISTVKGFILNEILFNQSCQNNVVIAVIGGTQ